MKSSRLPQFKHSTAKFSNPHSVPDSSENDKLSMKSNLDGPRGKTKKLARREENNKTEFLLKQKGNKGEEKNSLINQTKMIKFSNFLRKKKF